MLAPVVYGVFNDDQMTCNIYCSNPCLSINRIDIHFSVQSSFKKSQLFNI